MANYNKRLDIYYSSINFKMHEAFFYKSLNNIFLYMYISAGSEEKNIEKPLSSGNWAVNDQICKLIT